MNEPKVKPALRGVSHEVALYFAVAGAVVLIGLAPSLRAARAAAVYGVSLAALFGVSALYHRPMWPERARQWLRRADHSTIFVFIAGTYTPLCVLVGGPLGRALLAMAWTGAALGIVRAVAWPRAPRWISAGLYLLLGWMIVPFVGAVHRVVGPAGLLLLGGGGILYSVGALVYALRRPNPAPRVFGYHEVFHLMVIAASALHYALVTGVVRALG